MDGNVAPDDEGYLDSPPRLFERLRQIAGYTWDVTKEPLHSSYDNWYGRAPHVPLFALTNARKGKSLG